MEPSTLPPSLPSILCTVLKNYPHCHLYKAVRHLGTKGSYLPLGRYDFLIPRWPFKWLYLQYPDLLSSVRLFLYPRHEWGQSGIPWQWYVTQPQPCRHLTLTHCWPNVVPASQCVTASCLLGRFLLSCSLLLLTHTPPHVVAVTFDRHAPS